MSSPEYKYRVNLPQQVKKIVQKPIRGLSRHLKTKTCIKLKGEHRYLVEKFEHDHFQFTRSCWITRPEDRCYWTVDLRCRGCGKRQQISFPGYRFFSEKGMTLKEKRAILNTESPEIEPFRLAAVAVTSETLR